MTSPDNATPVKPPPSFSPGAPIVPLKTKLPDRTQSPQILRDTPPNPSVAPASATINSAFSAEHSESTSRSASPSGRLSGSTLLQNRSSIGSPLGLARDGSDDIRTLIIRAFSPPVGIYASEDTQELVRQKGFKGGFRELIRPFGEKVTGKVIIRDSISSSRAWEDYGIRFVDLAATELYSQANDTYDSPLAQMEEILQKAFDASEDSNHRFNRFNQGPNSLPASLLYQLLLRRLLSVGTPTSHETFGHPVACIIAISSRNKVPLESLRQLYAQTSQGDGRPPPWVHPDFLRYYVLVHDEDQDDIAESTKLYDQMKRHFGLHCHLLRLRSSQCVVTDDDSIEVPPCEWLSPFEDLRKMCETNALVDLGAESLYLFESDVTAIKAFVRELTVQSVIPFMENKVALWNDQVASRRRGISGRFMSISKRWAGFGSSSRSGSSGSSSGGVSGNYDPSAGFYQPDTPEALLRKLADFAFMLRDWKLSASTYELLRSDYSNDKAWRYHAGAHEMCAASILLNPLASAAKTKVENIDQMFETACYSYLTRCSDVVNTLRTLILAVELLKSRGGTATESAARWAMRISEFGLVGPIGHALLSERISACYASKTGTSGAKWGNRRRKAAMWNVFAGEEWLKLEKPALASACLEEADRFYADDLDKEGVFAMPDMQNFITGLKHAVKIEFLESRGINIDDVHAMSGQHDTEETREKLDHRTHRRSILGSAGPPIDPGTLSPMRLKHDDNELLYDDFE